MSIVVGVVLRPGVAEALADVSTLREVLEDAVIVSEATGYHANERLPGYVERVDRETFGARVELVVVFGGDGTLIHTAGLLVDRVVPILGVNLGRIGFLTEINVDQFARSLRMWRQGDLPHSDRMRLDIEVVHEGAV